MRNPRSPFGTAEVLAVLTRNSIPVQGISEGNALTDTVIFLEGIVHIQIGTKQRYMMVSHLDRSGRLVEEKELVSMKGLVQEVRSRLSLVVQPNPSETK